MQKTLILFFLGFAFFISFSAISQVPSPNKKNIQLKNDSTVVDLRNFDAQKIKDYSTQQEFKYDDQVSIDTSWWDRFWRWFWKLLNSSLNNSFAGDFLKYLVIAIISALVFFAISKFAGLDLLMFARKSKSIEVPYGESMENIHEIDFNEEINKAVLAGNFRLAVRLLYLRSLKLLTDRELINWQPEKTNQTYVDELIDLERKREFKVLTLQFEYIWYGDFAINEENFKALKGSFERFNVKAL